MLVFKLISQLGTATLAFAIGTGIVTGTQYFSSTLLTRTATQASARETKPLSGIYFVAPSTDTIGTSCNTSDREIYPFGWESYLQTHQIPPIIRSARDGRWFFFETKADNGNTYEYFGIIPDTVNSQDRNAKVVVPGKLIRLTNGEVTGNVDASYMAPACTFQ